MLEERRLEALEQLFEQVARYSRRERFLEQLMIALYGSGRQTEALAVCDVAGRRMRDDLGHEGTAGCANQAAAVAPLVRRRAPARAGSA